MATLPMARPVFVSPRGEPPSETLRARLAATRALTLALSAPLGAEDMAAQAIEEASPTKWHLAHTSWFFETFVLTRFLPFYELFDSAFGYCFNSYYDCAGARQPRPKRGLLSRPPLERVLAYRRHVEAGLERLFDQGVAAKGEAASLIELGVQHEQQHQELMLADILALFAANPLRPAYRAAPPRSLGGAAEPLRWIGYAGGIVRIGRDLGEGFSFDNETPRHDALIHPFAIADRPVTNGEWLEFVEDGGYRDPSLWLSDGWAAVEREGWEAPAYWERRGDAFLAMTLEGLRSPEPAAPVAHVSFYEADAFARWTGARLPTEFEWEAVAAEEPVAGNLLDGGALRPTPPAESFEGHPRQLFGDVWEWTGSAHLPYPSYRRPAGAIGEYNAKFMCDQHVLRGGCCVTPQGHIRASYRNFLYARQRWLFAGLRLARDVSR
ncbi:ergothioneine biosynthesis protein EgtB [Methylosinus sp. Ce-a6]|uniref:ergothioneine biosynthesis protein EgtB n=1 Tax=Methylosinus sp. Ce-a6 TaxID=2172005 RepID=UPI00135A6EC0|nr:ergothioneine biosynthesis protein EgtB [Methylosinus sp. Ce-a6]